MNQMLVIMILATLTPNDYINAVYYKGRQKVNESGANIVWNQLIREEGLKDSVHFVPATARNKKVRRD